MWLWWWTLACGRDDQADLETSPEPDTATAGTTSDTASTPVDTGTPPPTGDTGDATCPSEVNLWGVTACFETTADLVTPADPYAPQRVEGSGVVVEVGGVLADGPEPLSFVDGWGSCNVNVPHQVRIRDADGATWTFGWRVTDTTLDDSLAGIEVGAAVDFVAAWDWRWQGMEMQAGVLSITDAHGPLFLVELQAVLTDAERGGIGVAVDPTEGCTSADGEVRHHEVDFTWDGGSVTLLSRQTTTIPLGERELRWVLGQSVAFYGYPERGLETWWLGWALPSP